MLLIASAAILTGLAAKLVAVNRYGVGGLALLALLLVIDIAVVAVHHVSH